MTAETSGSTSDTLSGQRVLLVEDDYCIADEMRRILSSRGAEILGPVATVERALALLASNPAIDAAVLDVNLRDVMVFPVADALTTRGVPYIFATGYDGAVIPARYAHVQRCEKPVESRALVRALSAEVSPH